MEATKSKPKSKIKRSVKKKDAVSVPEFSEDASSSGIISEAPACLENLSQTSADQEREQENAYDSGSKVLEAKNCDQKSTLKIDRNDDNSASEPSISIIKEENLDHRIELEFAETNNEKNSSDKDSVICKFEISDDEVEIEVQNDCETEQFVAAKEIDILKFEITDHEVEIESQNDCKTGHFAVGKEIDVPNFEITDQEVENELQNDCETEHSEAAKEIDVQKFEITDHVVEIEIQNDCKTEQSVVDSENNKTAAQPTLATGTEEAIASCPEMIDVPNYPIELAMIKPLQETAFESSSRMTIHQNLYPTVRALAEEIEDDLNDIKPFSKEQILSMYRNAELERNTEFIDYFTLNQKEPQHTEFYEMLKCFLRARQNLVVSMKRQKEIEKDVSKQMEDVWHMIPETVSNKGPCSDGVLLTAFHKYYRAHFNDAAMSLLKTALQEAKEHIQETYSLHAYTTEVVKLQIENFIYCLLNSDSFRNIPFNAQISALQPHEIKYEEQKDLNVLRQCISDLFFFQRKPVTDGQFLIETRTWLSQLVAVLVRKATLNDHLFILNHILRCPAGINDWAISYVQPPSPVTWFKNITDIPSFGSSLLDHVVTTLATIMLPVQARESFMVSMKSSIHSSSLEDPSANIWVVVFDSEGEEDEDPETSWLQWQENDIVALLNQIPFGEIFRHALLINKIEESDEYDVRKSNEQAILKLIAFSSHLLFIFNEGFKTFNSLRFRQLSKRISRLIRHTVEYVTDHWEMFRDYRLPLDLKPHEQALLLRLQVEYDQFFLRATNVIFSSQKLGSWQFMAVLPYHCVSSQMMWRILWVLHNLHQEDQKEMTYNEFSGIMQLQDIKVKMKFVEMLESMLESEVFYLLTTFSNMAIARDTKETELVNLISLDIFEIAFLNERLRVTLSREGRDLLATIATKHLHVISVLLRKTIDSIHEIEMMALFLFRGLPLHLWKPSKDDLDILSHCLLDNSLKSPFNQLAKLVLSGLNWGFDVNNENLHLHPNIHREVAITVVKACYQFEKEEGHIIYRSIQQVLFLAQSLRDNAVTSTTSQGFATWAWDLLLSLHLHAVDYPNPPWIQVISGNVQSVSSLSEQIEIPIFQQAAYLQPLNRGLEEKKPAATFVALIMTNIGHNMEHLIESGLSLWSDLVAKGVYYASAHTLFYILPFFYTHPEKLLLNERFISDLQLLVLSDLSYSSLVSQEFPGKTLKFLAGTMLGQINHAKMYTMEVGGQALKLWCTLLLKILESGQKGLLAKWKGANNVFYLLDKLMEVSVLDNYMLDTLRITLSGLVKNPLPSNTGVVSSLFSIMAWSGTGQEWPSLIPSNTLPSFPWLFLFILSAETSHSQMDLLWKSTLTELSMNFQSTVDVAIKKSSHNLKMSCPKLESLPIYRLANNSLETENVHPSLPLLWQCFFNLYLQRTSNQPINAQRGSLGFKFFDGDYHLPLLKKMKRKLIESADMHYNLYKNANEELEKLSSSDFEDDVNNGEKEKIVTALEKKKNHYYKLTEIFRAFSLWIGEPRLHDSNLNLSAFPPQYCVNRLKDVLQDSKTLWLDLLDVDAIHSGISEIEKNWLSQRRVVVVPLRYGKKNETPALNRILKRLKTYEEPVPPPQLPSLKPVVLEASSDILNTKNLYLESVQSGCRTICEQARDFSDRLSKHIALDTEYINLLPHLYINASCQKIERLLCQKRLSEGCAGAAVITLKFKEARPVSRTQADIDLNRRAYVGVINDSMQHPSSNVCCAVVYIENSVTSLVKSYRQHGLDQTTSKNRLREMGLTLFHSMMSLVGETTNCYPPTRQFFASTLEVLGQEFIFGQEDQCLPLIKAALSRPWLTGLVAPLFSPKNVSVETYIQLYEYLVQNLTTSTAHTVFVLLSKFDLFGWLNESSPSFSECETLVNLIENAFIVIGMKPDDNLQVVSDIYRNHLQLLLQHNFPLMYGSVLNLIIKGTGKRWLNTAVWDDFLKFLGAISKPPLQEFEVLQSWFAAYTVSTTILYGNLVMDTIEVLCNNFKKVFHEYKASLYSSYNSYIDKFAFFIGIVCHVYIFSSVNNAVSSVIENTVNMIWGKIRKLFQYWIEPLERPYSPWTNDEVEQANSIFFVFTSCIKFLYGLLPEPVNIKLLSIIYEFYCKTYCKETMKKHIQFVCHSWLQILPWEKFIVNSFDIKTTKEVIQKKCNKSLIKSIFLKIPWFESIEKIVSEGNRDDTSTFCFNWALTAIQLSFDSDLKQDKIFLNLFEQIEVKAPWHILHVENVKALIDESSKLFNPLEVVLQNPNHSETIISKFIQYICGVSPPPSYSQSSISRNWQTPFLSDNSLKAEKRNIYMAFHIQLIVRAACTDNRKNNFFNKNSDNFKHQIKYLLRLSETAIGIDDFRNQFSNATSLLVEFLNILGTTTPAPLQELVLNELVLWWKNYPGSVLLCPCVIAACKTLPYVRHLVVLVEACLETYCSYVSDTSSPYGSWGHIIPLLEIPLARKDEFLSACIDHGAHFCQNTYLMKNLPMCQSLAEELDLLQKVLDWVCKIKSDEESEAKVLFLWDKIFELSLRQLDYGGDIKATERVLNNFTTTLLTFGEDKVSIGLLGAIGFGKRSPFSARMRFMCRTIATFVSLQLPTNGDIRLQQNSPGHVRTLQEGRGRPSQLAQQAIGKLENLKNNKQYSVFHDATEYVWSFVMNPEYSLRDAQSLVKEISNLFFPTTKYLCILNMRQTSNNL